MASGVPPTHQGNTRAEPENIKAKNSGTIFIDIIDKMMTEDQIRNSTADKVVARTDVEEQLPRVGKEHGTKPHFQLHKDVIHTNHMMGFL